MKPNNAGKNLWLRAQTAIQKLKQNAQTRKTDGMRAFFCFIYDKDRGFISTIILVIEGGGSEP